MSSVPENETESQEDETSSRQVSDESSGTDSSSEGSDDDSDRSFHTDSGNCCEYVCCARYPYQYRGELFRDEMDQSAVDL